MIESGIPEKLEWIRQSLPFFVPELALVVGILLVLTIGIAIPGIRSGRNARGPLAAGIAVMIFSGGSNLVEWVAVDSPVALFSGMVRADKFSGCLKLLCDVAGL